LPTALLGASLAAWCAAIWRRDRGRKFQARGLLPAARDDTDSVKLQKKSRPWVATLKTTKTKKLSSQIEEEKHLYTVGQCAVDRTTKLTRISVVL
jgi:hypothetical protein